MTTGTGIEPVFYGSEPYVITTIRTGNIKFEKTLAELESAILELQSSALSNLATKS